MIQTIILCGGSGTRLWPLSRRSYPKQFVPLIAGRNLLELAFERIKHLGIQSAAHSLICVGSEEHRFLIKDAAEAAGVRTRLILEPVPRNTAAAMTLAALQVDATQKLLFMPADHHIPDVSAFASMVHNATHAAEGDTIVVFGVTPTAPSTAYGYLQKGVQRGDGSWSVARFLEKPHLERARELLLDGDVFWNSGIFLCTASTFLRAMAEHAPDILASCRAAITAATVDGEFVRPGADAFNACRGESIDYAVMEKYRNVVVFPFNGIWNDVGSWDAVADLCPADAAGNRIAGNGLAIDAETTYIHAPMRRVVALGTRDLFIVDTADALLVAAKSAAEDVRSVVAQLEAESGQEALTHRKVVRPWGWYDSLVIGGRFHVKHIYVKPGGALSLQMHHHRAEHWVVVRGTAEVTRGSDTFLLAENQSTYIPLGEVHRVRNPGKTELEIIEVQSGSYLGEDDIVRFEDVYGRTVTAMTDPA